MLNSSPLPKKRNVHNISDFSRKKRLDSSNSSISSKSSDVSFSAPKNKLTPNVSIFSPKRAVSSPLIVKPHQQVFQPIDQTLSSANINNMQWYNANQSKPKIPSETYQPSPQLNSNVKRNLVEEQINNMPLPPNEIEFLKRNQIKSEWTQQWINFFNMLTPAQSQMYRNRYLVRCVEMHDEDDSFEMPKADLPLIDLHFLVEEYVKSQTIKQNLVYYRLFIVIILITVECVCLYFGFSNVKGFAEHHMKNSKELDSLILKICKSNTSAISGGCGSEENPEWSLIKLVLIHSSIFLVVKGIYFLCTTGYKGYKFDNVNFSSLLEFITNGIYKIKDLTEPQEDDDENITETIYKERTEEEQIIEEEVGDERIREAYEKKKKTHQREKKSSNDDNSITSLLGNVASGFMTGNPTGVINQLGSAFAAGGGNNIIESVTNIFNPVPQTPNNVGSSNTSAFRPNSPTTFQRTRAASPFLPKAHDNMFCN